MNEEMQRSKDWAALYDALLTALEPHGRNDAVGNGDYWLVDDDWGSYQHKLCVTRLPFLTSSVTKTIQATLSNFPAWEVVVALDFKDPSRSSDGEGISVRHSAIEEHWDPLRLRQRFGAEFRWGTE